MAASAIMTPLGLAALKSREGERLTAYRDSVGVWTISVGITSASGLIKVTPGLTITKAQSDALFAKGVAQYAGPVSAAVKVPLADHQFDALVSLCFNIGAPSFAKSTIVRRLNAGDYAGAAEAILMWNKPAVIIPRRQAEYDQFRTPYSVKLPSQVRGGAPIKTGSSSSPAPAPAKPLADKAPAAPVAQPIKTPSKVGQPAPLGFWASLFAALRTNMAKGA
ncbi:lysozyme [Methylobacterium sp. Leaf91]|uniref:lysozyme n=1 Tax=Methylobacterium sp. Leaf91 TaxID=1736247 RepID=UPI000B14DFF4|nr:lysozyme [Methylobacterium sp. Leaf91]